MESVCSFVNVLTIILLFLVAQTLQVGSEHGGRLVYSSDFLKQCRPTIVIPSKQKWSFEFSSKTKTKRKRGKKGGVRKRVRQRGTKPPLPSIIMANVRSLRNKTDILDALCKFDSDYKNICAICLSETWLTNLDSDRSIDIDGFSVYRMDRDTTQGKSKGGGVCTYINNKWCAIVRTLYSISRPDIELLSIALRPHYLPREFNQINLINVYVPPDANKAIAQDTIKDCALSFLLNNPDAPVIIVGDFNTCRLNESTIFKQYVTTATRGDKILDMCYCNVEDAYKSVSKAQIGNSDHKSVLLLPTYIQKLKKEKPLTVNKNIWTTEALDTLRGCLECTKWEVLTPDHCSMEDWNDAVTDYIKFCCDSCSVNKTIKIFPNNKPWVTKRLKMLINEKKRAHMSGDRTQLYLAQCKLRKVIKEEKEAYKNKMEEQLKQCNAAQAWEMLRTMSGIDSKKSRKLDTLMKIDENSLNNFFSRFETTPSLNGLSDIYAQGINTQFQMPIEIKEEEVNYIFKILNKNKAPGPDGLNGFILKECRDQLSSIFTKLFQRSIDENAIPKIWKTSTIIPIPKIAKPVLLNDYRPVALTPIPMKCLEKILKRHLMNEVMIKLDPLQFAYQPNKGVEDAVLTVINKITSHIDACSRNYARILFVDFSSAFNSMNSGILVEKLKSISRNDQLTNWYENFLRDRPQRTKIGNNLSNERILSNGCPQGCVSSPLLYIIYTNDCVASVQNCHIIKYADDTAILGLIDPSYQSMKNYTDQINDFGQWCHDNCLELNVKKTKEEVIDFRSITINHEPIKINNEQVEIVSKFKYLGIVIDNKLRFKEHIEITVQKANKRLYILRKLRSFNVRKKTIIQVYQCLIKSIICFGITTWYSSSGVREHKRIQDIIRQASKIVNCSLEGVLSLWENETVRKAFKIISNPKHPLAPCYTMLKSGKRFAAIKTRTNRYKQTFIPTSVSLLNKRKQSTSNEDIRNVNDKKG